MGPIYAGNSLYLGRDGTAEGVVRDMKNDEKDAPLHVWSCSEKEKKEKTQNLVRPIRRAGSLYSVKLSNRRPRSLIRMHARES